MFHDSYINCDLYVLHDWLTRDAFLAGQFCIFILGRVPKISNRVPVE